MRLDYIETFHWAATLGSVTAAGERMNVAQTAATARIRVLERELGRPLFERRRDKRMHLTADGSRFLQRSEELLQLWRRLRADFGSSPSPTRLRIGVIESVLHSWLIPWMEALNSERPQLELELTVETTPFLNELLQRGGLDFAVTTLPVGGEGIHTRALTAMPMTFAGSKQHDRRRAYTLPQLAQRGLLTFQRGSAPHAALLDLLRRAPIAGARVHAVSSISAMARMVASGFGVATLPQATLTDPVVGPPLRALRCSTKLAPLPIYASWRDDPSSEELDAVLAAAVAARDRTGQASRARPSRRQARET